MAWGRRWLTYIQILNSENLVIIVSMHIKYLTFLIDIFSHCPPPAPFLVTYCFFYLAYSSNSLCSLVTGSHYIASGCPGTHSVDQAGYDLRDPSASVPQVGGINGMCQHLLARTHNFIKLSPHSFYLKKRKTG